MRWRDNMIKEGEEIPTERRHGTRLKILGDFCEE